MSQALVISASDNVATALETLVAGETIRLGDVSLTVLDSIPRGHKVALRAIARGEAVVKYGSPIGTASSDIRAGTHVHTHNLESTRGRGDLGRSATVAVRPPGADPSAPRIAEPPDRAEAGSSR